MGEWVDTPDIPDWVYNPRKKVLTIILGFVVGGLSTVLHAITTGVFQPIQSVLDVFHDTGLIVGASIESVAESILTAERAITGIFVDLGRGAGLAAPLVNVAIALGAFLVVFVVVLVVVQVLRVVNPQ